MTSAPSHSQIHFQTLTQEALERRLRDFGGSDFDRESRLRNLFFESGCKPEELSEQIVKGKQPPNLICVVPGASNEEIVVGAHFDHVSAGDGVVDNWSGASLLPSLLFSIKKERREHTYVFIGFMGEEHELMGSTYYTGHPTKEQRTRIRAMVNLDTLGLGPTEVWVSHSDDQLLRTLDAVARALQAPLLGMNADQVGTTDSESFARYKIPRITLHTLTQETLPILHSPKDRFDKIQISDYFASYQLIAGFLVALDT